MGKFDFKKDMKHLYQPSAKEVSVVDVPELNFLMLDGHGDPNTSQEYQEAIEALYAVAFQLKFLVKGRDPQLDFVVPPLEGLWWTENMSEFTVDDKGAWEWIAMIAQPEHVTKNLFMEAVELVKAKKDLPALDKIRFERFHEGMGVQILHIGPFSAEGPTIERLHTFARDNGYKLRGKHHEIYLSDFRRTAPEKLKTVIRQPVQ